MLQLLYFALGTGAVVISIPFFVIAFAMARFDKGFKPRPMMAALNALVGAGLIGLCLWLFSL
ncbi:hypothetical protein [Streptomyces sp. cg35]|uniref:hypothetical protein n=1 Tax=Streptomyces sp. cg35 TaxID=3421650 RepID=UPI003D16EEB9